MYNIITNIHFVKLSHVQQNDNDSPFSFLLQKKKETFHETFINYKNEYKQLYNAEKGIVVESYRHMYYCISAHVYDLLKGTLQNVPIATKLAVYQKSERESILMYPCRRLFRQINVYIIRFFFLLQRNYHRTVIMILVKIINCVEMCA